MQLNGDEREEILIPIRRLSSQIKKGEISLKQLKKIVELFLKSSIPAIIVIRLFGVNYISQNKTLTEKERKKYMELLNRYLYGIISGIIKREEYSKIQSSLSTSRNNISNSLKQNLTQNDIKRYMELISKLVTKHKIDEVPYTLNIRNELEKIINKGIYEGM
jgi:hypothetical protein